MFRRKRIPVTAVSELNDLLAADDTERQRIISGLSDSVVRGLLAYLVSERKHIR